MHGVWPQITGPRLVGKFSAVVNLVTYSDVYDLVCTCATMAEQFVYLGDSLSFCS